MQGTSKPGQHWARFAGMALAVAALAGCGVPRAVQQPPAATLAHTHWPHAEGAAADAIAAQWWQAFGSDELNHLVTLAHARSQDIAASAARMRQAQAAAHAAGAVLWPALEGGLSAQRASRATATGGQASLYGASLVATYEVDFWGRNRAAHEAASAAWQASRFARDTVRLTVTAQVAHGWLQAVALRERQHIAQQNLATVERFLALVESRVRAGAASSLELAQQRGLVAAQKQMLAELRGQGEGAAGALSLLLGQARRVDLRTPSLQALVLPRVGAGLPAQLLERRPDIAQAEALLAAASADVQAARAALWPRLTLTGSAATSAGRAADWLHAPVATLLAGLAGPIFDGGRLAAQHDAAQARREELLANYHKAIVAAFTDVELALDASASLEEQARAQDEALVQARAALALAESRYRSGAETMLALLDAQRVVTAAQDAQVQIRLARLQAAVSLYRALGGGWRPPEATPMAQAEPLP